VAVHLSVPNAGKYPAMYLLRAAHYPKIRIRREPRPSFLFDLVESRISLFVLLLGRYLTQ
jgi:hypothetical protein